jgi:hypothetical protein
MPNNTAADPFMTRSESVHKPLIHDLKDLH